MIRGSLLQLDVGQGSRETQACENDAKNLVQTAVQNQESPKEPIKELFKRFDKDGNGVLSRDELRWLLQWMGSEISDAELGLVFDAIDEDGNNELDIDEFVEWVMSPASMLQISPCSGTVRKFDLAAALRPLFEVYDRDGTGTIGLQEFKELHTILQGAIRVHADEQPDDMFADEVGAFQDAERVFREVDLRNDGSICLDEFVAWQRGAIEDAEISKTRCIELVSKLATLLHSLHTVEQALLKRPEGKQDLMREDWIHVAEPVEKQIAQIASELYAGDDTDEQSGKHNRSVGHVSTWSSPDREANNPLTSPTAGDGIWKTIPDDMCRASLLRAHMATVPVPTCNVENVKFDICPSVPAYTLGRKNQQRWLAKVLRKVRYKQADQCISSPKSRSAARGGRSPRKEGAKAKAKAKAKAAATSEPEPPDDAADDVISEHFYSYEEDGADGDRLKWKLLPDGREYSVSLRALSPELHVLAFILTEADFSATTWAGLQKACNLPLSLGLMEAQRYEVLSEAMQVFAAQAVSKSYKDVDRLSSEMKQKLVNNYLEKTFMLTPWEAMNVLEDAGLVKSHALWKGHENLTWEEYKPESLWDKRERRRSALQNVLRE